MRTSRHPAARLFGHTARPWQRAGARPWQHTGARPWRRIEARLWTGPLGHLLGGGLDFGQGLARYLLARARGQIVR